MLWKKVMSGLSAGRVQSVATRLVVDRERERMAFRVASYWDLEGTFDAGAEHEQRMFPAKLHSVDDVPGRPRLRLRPRRRSSPGKKRASSTSTAPAPRRWPTRCATRRTTSARSSPSPTSRSPYAPFRTTTLQQEAVAQARHERLGDDVGGAAALRERLHHLHADRLDHAVGRGGQRGAVARSASCTAPEYLPDAPRTYASQGQERPGGARGDPAGRATRSARPAQTGLTGEQFRLYELIWMRTVASQMKDAVGQSVTIRLGGAAADGERRRVLRDRPDDHLPRLPQGLRRGHRRRRSAATTTETRLPDAGRGRRASRPRR